MALTMLNHKPLMRESVLSLRQLRRGILVAAVFIVFLPRAESEIISADRRVDWTQVGVPGGVPARVTVFKTLSDIDASGNSDVAPAIQGALDSCPPDQVVLLPEGTFKIGRTIMMPNHVVLRGAGPRTVVTGEIAADMIKFYGPYWRYADPIAISAGASKGSTRLTLGGSTDVAVGIKVQVQCDNDPTIIFDGSEGSGGAYAKGQWVEITSVAGNVVNISPPLYQDYPAAMNPRIRFPVNGANANRNFVEYSGIENLTVKNTSSSCTSNVSMQFAAYCWMKGVTSKDGGICHVWPLDTYRCEVRDSSFTGILPPITSSRGYGIQMGTPGGNTPSSKTSAMLVENNIFDGNRGHLIIGYGAAGCVVGYNYFTNAVNEVANVQKMDIAFHSSYPMMNLVEGNTGVRGVVADTFHGNSNYNVIYRNWWKGKADGKDSALGSIELDAYQRYFSAIGNVLGYGNIVADVASLRNPDGQSVYERKSPDAVPYSNFYKAWMLGYDGEGGGTTRSDPMVASSLIRHGNFDYVTNETRWDATISDHSLPESLYYSGKPRWWPGNVPWPPLGPDRTPITAAIPAELRFSGSTADLPLPPTGLHVIPSGN